MDLDVEKMCWLMVRFTQPDIKTAAPSAIKLFRIEVQDQTNLVLFYKVDTGFAEETKRKTLKNLSDEFSYYYNHKGA